MYICFSPPACAFPSLTAPLHAPFPFYTARHTPPQRRARTPAPLSLTPVRPQNASPKHRISRTCLVISNEHCTFAHGNQRQDHQERCRSGRTGRTRNAVNGQLFRGFESLSLRNKVRIKQMFDSHLFYIPKNCGIIEVLCLKAIFLKDQENILQDSLLLLFLHKTSLYRSKV